MKCQSDAMIKCNGSPLSSTKIITETSLQSLARYDGAINQTETSEPAVPGTR